MELSTTHLLLSHKPCREAAAGAISDAEKRDNHTATEKMDPLLVYCTSAESSSCSSLIQEHKLEANTNVSINMNELCSMCGDLGMADHLFLCIKCSHRYQHTYCSRSYPNMGPEALICNWCLHDGDSLSAKLEISTNSNPNPNEKFNHPQASAEDGEQSMRRKHSKAFEYLLMIAESFPHEDDNQVITEANDGLRQTQYASTISNTDKIMAFGGHIPRRQRCAKGINALKCRKKGLQLSPPRASYRRYKLLADVLC